MKRLRHLAVFDSGYCHRLTSPLYPAWIIHDRHFPCHLEHVRDVDYGNFARFVVVVEVPPGPVADALYVVVTEGVTVTLPCVGLVPMPLSIATEVALVADHVRVVLAPSAMEAGLALNVTIGGGAVVP